MDAEEFDQELARIRVVPVITIQDSGRAVDLGQALVAGGLRILEVTLRTAAGLDAIAELARAVPDAIVGAGSVRTADQLRAARAAGARFIVAPGCTERLGAAALEDGGPFIPGAATASEVMRLTELGFTLVKFFPAQSSGGPAALRAFSGPFPDVRFCPTGGIDLARAPDYLALPNVVCIGGSWMLPDRLVSVGDYDAVRELAGAASDALSEPSVSRS
jgi:2-dehydro-3-deoxyphosphogluconate aldolase / (4S)-4-hydroxy-2-oxoglutarate aldolase